MNMRRGYTVRTCAAALIGLSLPASVLHAEDPRDELLMRAQTARQQRVKQAGRVFDRLDLTRSQARRLVPLAEQAAALHLEAHAAEAQLLPEMLEAFAEFAKEDSLNQGFSPPVERRTAKLNRRAKDVRERITEQLIALAEQASTILKAEQRERLENPPRKQRPARTRPQRTDARSRARIAQRQREEARRRPLVEARRELSELHQQRYPKLGPIGQYVLHPLGAERLCRIARMRVPEVLSQAADALRNGTSESPIESVEQQKAELRSLRAAISNWNLINGLHLGEEQIARITAAYDQAAKPTWEIAKLDRRSGVPRAALVSLEREVEQILNTGQRQVLAEFKTCLIPPKNLKDPVRVGQVSNNSAYERWLERARKLSKRELAEHIDQGLEKEAEHHGALSRDERRKRVALLRRTVRQAGAMSDTEFELNKAELAERIAPPDRVQQARDKIAGLARELGEPGAVARLMLSPRFMDQLRLRGRQLAEGIATEPVDLAVGPQADNCDESCAIDGKGGRGKKNKKK